MGKVIQTNHSGITCFEVVNRWVAKYFERELPPKTALKIDGHLQECERCNNQYHEYSKGV